MRQLIGKLTDKLSFYLQSTNGVILAEYIVWLTYLLNTVEPP